MPKCPYCNNEIHIENFYEVIIKESRKGKIKKKRGSFKGETIHLGYRNQVRMWVCPSCDNILGFSEYRWDNA